MDDGYQTRIGRAVGIPRSLIDLFALTVVVEERAQRRYLEHAKRTDVDPETLAILHEVTKDEKWHIGWIKNELKAMARANGGEGKMRATLQRYRDIDRQVVADLLAKEREAFGFSFSDAPSRVVISAVCLGVMPEGIRGAVHESAEPAPAVSQQDRPRRKKRIRPAREKRHLLARIEYVLFLAAFAFFRALPFRLAFRVGEGIGTLLYWLDRPHRRVGLTNLALAFPAKDKAERHRILRESFRNLGRLLAEFCHLRASHAREYPPAGTV